MGVSNTTIQYNIYLPPELVARIKLEAIERDKLLRDFRDTGLGMPDGVVPTTGQSGVVHQVLYNYFADRDAEAEQLRMRVARHETVDGSGVGGGVGGVARDGAVKAVGSTSRTKAKVKTSTSTSTSTHKRAHGRERGRERGRGRTHAKESACTT